MQEEGKGPYGSEEAIDGTEAMEEPGAGGPHGVLDTPVTVHVAGVHARGRTGYACVLRDGKSVLGSAARSRSRGSGPQAEHLAVLLALETAERVAPGRRLAVQSGSELAVCQLLGTIGVRSPELQEITTLVRGHPAASRVTIEHRATEHLRDALSLARRSVGASPTAVVLRPYHPLLVAFRGHGVLESHFEILDGRAVEFFQWAMVPLEPDLRPFPGVGTCLLECSSSRLAKRLAQDEPLEGKRYMILCEEHHGFRLYRVTPLGTVDPGTLPATILPVASEPGGSAGGDGSSDAGQTRIDPADGPWSADGADGGGGQ